MNIDFRCFVDLHLWGEGAREPLNNSPRVGAPGFGMGCEAQSTAIPGGIASICNEADRPNTGCDRREGVVQRFPRLSPASRASRHAAFSSLPGTPVTALARAFNGYF
jgi:hypothetical protein